MARIEDPNQAVKAVDWTTGDTQTLAVAPECRHACASAIRRHGARLGTRVHINLLQSGLILEIDDPIEPPAPKPQTPPPPADDTPPCNPGDVIFVGDPQWERLIVTVEKVYRGLDGSWCYEGRTGVGNYGTHTGDYFNARPWRIYKRATPPAPVETVETLKQTLADSANALANALGENARLREDRQHLTKALIHIILAPSLRRRLLDARPEVVRYALDVLQFQAANNPDSALAAFPAALLVADAETTRALEAKG